MDFIYERVRVAGDIKLELVTGGARFKGKVWREIATQIYCENGKEDFREIGHYASGAPFLYGACERISISHTDGCLAVATIKTPENASLAEFDPATALGIDVEKVDREKVMGLKERFLSADELKIVASDSLEANIIAWTSKEAMLKAGMDNRINWHTDIQITLMPEILKDGFAPDSSKAGAGFILIEGRQVPFRLYSYRSDGYIITIAR